MISKIRIRIDEANNASENGVGNNDGQRVSIPSMELAELSAVRRGEYTRRLREDLNSRILEMDEAVTRANQVDAVDGQGQRQFGLPLGQACEDIWELIFEHVDDVEDIANLRDTCVLFREMLERKYAIFRFAQVASKFANQFGRFHFLLNLRRVCKSSKAVVDKFLSEDRQYYDRNMGIIDPYVDEHWVPRVMFCFRPQEASLDSLEKMIENLELLQIAPDHFPVKQASVIELRGTDDNSNTPRLNQADAGARHNPLLPRLRTRIQSFLELKGSCIRYFEYISVKDGLGTYNQLNSWLALMPRLEDLAVGGLWMYRDPGTPPLPSPSCPRLKRFINKGMRFGAPFVERIIRANPGLSDVCIYYIASMEREEWDYVAALVTLDALQLERFTWLGINLIPPHQFLEFRCKWALKSLQLLVFGEDATNREISSRTMFKFINSFSATLEELAVNWKVRDTGGYLDVPKVTKLCWKLWPSFISLEFIIALKNLQYFDVDVEACRWTNNSLEDVKGFINNNDFPSLFPALRRVQTRMEAGGEWRRVWKS